MTKNRVRIVALTLAIFVGAWLATDAFADRPSLAAFEAANCAKADIDGDSYRPFYCDAECECDIAGLPAGGTCSETTPGDFDYDWTLYDQCVQAQEVCSSGFCISDPPVFTGGSCASTADCDPGFGCGIMEPLTNICFMINPTGGTSCVDANDCQTIQVCERPPGSDVACTTDGECSGGETCQFDGFCGTGCTTNNDCSGQPFNLSIDDVAAPDSITPVTCLGGPVNHKDARACLVQLGCDLCGDGSVDSGETCDDGNITPGDGCDASCQTE